MIAMEQVNQIAIEFLANKYKISIVEICIAIKNNDNAKKQYFELMELGMKTALDANSDVTIHGKLI